VRYVRDVEVAGSNPVIPTRQPDGCFFMNIHFTYIIESLTTGKWYYGYTVDIEGRLDGHNKGMNTSTRNRGPWKYIFIRPFDNKKDATDFERYLKKSRNKDFIRRQIA
jgi:putative endonuclease